MIELKKDEACITDANLLCVTGGIFEEDDLVELYYKNTPENTVSFHALYIKEGRFPE